MRKAMVCATAAMLLALCGQATAAPTIINVDATDFDGVDVFFEAGTYRFEMIGVADGGAYDAWNPWGQTSCTAPDACTMGWTNHLAVEGVDLAEYIPLPPAPYAWSTPLGSLNAWKGASQVLLFLNGAEIGPVSNPGVYTYATPVTFTFRVGDGPGAFADNLGGISLRVTDLTETAIPEPASWALMILGFGAIGAMLRRGRTAAAY